MISIGHNKKILLNRRRELRKHQTDAELKLWQRLRAKRLSGLKFSRQYGVGRYILDFFCFEARLAIELDGSQHAEPSQVAYDLERTEFLAESGINVLRFWNHEVINEIESVMEKIRSFLQDSPQPSLSERGPKEILP